MAAKAYCYKYEHFWLAGLAKGKEDKNRGVKLAKQMSGHVIIKHKKC